ncbi:methyl-accepting chemotaxis protein [Nitrospiraceae bacterium AH_259_D15_M11_P09]|nr:methyl-accepting chemotaxis protein [Nitrospiraceae bacterium AH_259_D15_M11_P09]
MNYSFKRRRILIDPVQFRLFAVHFLHIVIILVVFAATLFVPLMMQLGSETLSWVEKEEVANQFLALHRRVWPPLIAVFVLLVIHLVVFSHRIVGPLVRFRMIFKAIAEGNLTVRSTIRKHDYLQKEADGIQEMVDSLRTKFKGIEEQSGEVREGVAELKRAVASGSVEDMKRNLKGLEAQMERLKAYVDQFRTTP